jgi:hypothetical protein
VEVDDRVFPRPAPAGDTDRKAHKYVVSTNLSETKKGRQQMIPFSTIWTEFQGDSANSGYAALNTGPAKDHKWTAPAPSPGGGSPIVNPLDGAIYVADGVGQYRDNGVALWTRSGGTNDQWGSTPATEARKNKNFNTPGCKTGGL